MLEIYTRLPLCCKKYREKFRDNSDFLKRLFLFDKTTEQEELATTLNV